MDTNELKLIIPDATNISFEVTEFMVSANQAYNNSEIEKLIVSVKADEDNADNNLWILTIEANRHKTAEVAEKFADWIKSDNPGDVMDDTADHCIAETSSDKVPGELNFTVKGDLTFEENGFHYTLKDLVIAQGSNTFHNNWWIGGKGTRKIFEESILAFGFHSFDDDATPIESEDSPHVVLFKVKGVNEFEVAYGAYDLHA